MFGYVNINKKLQEGQQGLWQAFMCGLCMSTKKLFGNLPRMFITNDVNFLNVLFHSVQQIDVELADLRCFSHPVKKRPMVEPTTLSDRMSVANVILTYYKLYDDVLDGGGLKKRAALAMYKKPYKLARQQWQELDEVVDSYYAQLRELEQSGCDSLDRVSHCFACLSQQVCKLVLGEQTTEFAETLCYNLGKWIYLIDALDDFDKDVKKHNYNPFAQHYGATTVEELRTHIDEVHFIMYAVLNRTVQSYNDLNLTKYSCILKNVLYDSIREKTKQVLAKFDVADSNNSKLRKNAS